MIVKNEERFLAQCLRSVADVVDEIIITDTGSTDRTIEIAKSFGATVIEREWRNDFAWARNQSLELATKRWIIALDADEELTEASKPVLRKLRDVPAYREAIWVRFLNQSDDYKGTGAMSHALVRIFPNDPEIRYRGLIHEFPSFNNDPNGLQGAIAPIEIVHHGYMSEIVHQRKKGERNLALVKAAAEADPTDAFHWFNLGTTAFLIDDFELARDALEKMIEVNAGATRGFMPNALAVLAETYCDKLNQPLKGEEISRLAISYSPHYANAHFQLGKALVAQQRYDQAREAYQHAIDDGAYAHLQFVVDDQVYRWKAHCEIGSTYVMQGDDAAGTEWFRKALANAPGVEPLQLNLARSLERQGLFREAKEYYEAAFRDHRTGQSTVDFVNFLLRRGDGLSALGLIDSTYEELRDPYDTAMLYAAWQIAVKHSLPNPLAYLERAAERKPASAEFLNPLEEAYRRAGDSAAMEALLRREKEHEPKEPADFLRRSYQALGEGDFAVAAALAQQGLEIDPGSAGLRYNAALALGRLGQRDESDALLRGIPSDQGEVYVAAELLLAASARESGKTEEAVAAVSRLLTVAPRNADALALGGALHEGRGDLQEAERALRSLFDLDRQRGAVELSSFFLRHNRYVEAAQIADRALNQLDYSIIIPVFNKANLTKQCLETLRPTLEGAGAGEVIVIDNASTDETPQIMEAFPWVRYIRNETNVGFAGANNQGAREANGIYLVLLNNDTEGTPGWLASMLANAKTEGVGAVGARLLFANNTIQHAGVAVTGLPFSRQAVAPYHYNYSSPADLPETMTVMDLEVVTGACVVTPRELYMSLGGLDEAYWNGYEDVDYCFKVRERGLRVVYDGNATLYHYESQSGAQRFRRAYWNCELLTRRWDGRVRFDAVDLSLTFNKARHIVRESHGRVMNYALAMPPIRVLVHGALPESQRPEFEAMLRATKARISSIVYLGGPEDVERAGEAIELRGYRYAVFVDARSRLDEGWLDELIRQVETTVTAAAATYNPEAPLGKNVRVFAPDARATLISLQRFPAHVRLRRFDSWDGIVADFVLQVLSSGYGTRGCEHRLGTLPAASDDASFERERGRSVLSLHRDDPEAIVRLLARPERKRGLVSIVTLSWNAPEFTRAALDSFARFTSEPYEVIVVDNGSKPATIEMLKAIDDPHVRVIYNPTNRGFAGGNNDGIAAARGEYLVLINNDVVVTEGWLDGLLRPFGVVPHLGVSAPRSNRIVGDQLVHNAVYDGEQAMHAFANERSRRFRGRGYFTDRAIGFCLCVDRRVIEEVGGFDEAYGVGNFEDDDFSIRVRGAGYRMFVCDDVFIHHVGSQSFAANNVDYMATMHSNWSVFAEKWDYPSALPSDGYDPRAAIYRGFDRKKHYAPIPAAR